MSGQHAANMTFWGPGPNQNKQKHMDFDADGSSMGHGRVLFFFWIHFGKHTKNYGKIHHFSWENSLFQWPFSIANC